MQNSNYLRNRYCPICGKSENIEHLFTCECGTEYTKEIETARKLWCGTGMQEYEIIERLKIEYHKPLNSDWDLEKMKLRVIAKISDVEQITGYKNRMDTYILDDDFVVTYIGSHGPSEYQTGWQYIGTVDQICRGEIKCISEIIDDNKILEKMYFKN